MATRLSNDYYGVMIADDTTYGTQQFDLDGATVLPVQIDIKKIVSQAELTQKTNTLEPKIQEKTVTSTACQVTIKGDLCPEYQLLLDAFFEEYTVEGAYYTIPVTQPAGYTYNIYKVYPGTSIVYDVALGCKCTSFVITGESNGVYQFEAVFDGYDMRRGIANTGDDELDNLPANDSFAPFIFGDTSSVSITGTGAFEHILNLTLTLTKEKADDAVLYQNSTKKLSEIITGYKGNLSVNYLYDDALDPAIESNIIGISEACAFTLGTSAYTWGFALNTLVSDIAIPDNGKGMCISNTTLELVNDDIQPIILTITEL